MLRTQMFPCLPLRATFVAETKFVSETQMFLISFRNILCLQQMFPSLRSIETIMSNNVSATLCPCLPPPLVMVLGLISATLSCLVFFPPQVCVCVGGALLQTVACNRAHHDVKPQQHVHTTRLLAVCFSLEIQLGSAGQGLKMRKEGSG